MTPRPPPRSTLFPYTTLSDLRPGDRDGRGDAQGDDVDWLVGHRVAVAALVIGMEALGEALPVVGDRKSTRLNSSHMSISYAVFCLKKKTQLSSHSQE